MRNLRENSRQTPARESEGQLSVSEEGQSRSCGVAACSQPLATQKHDDSLITTGLSDLNDSGKV